jgi:hypothetical protein
VIEFASQNQNGFNSPKISKVFLDGEDITNQCFALNEATGFVGMIVKRDGRSIVEGGHIKRTFARGVLKVERLLRRTGNAVAHPL